MGEPASPPPAKAFDPWEGSKLPFTVMPDGWLAFVTFGAYGTKHYGMEPLSGLSEDARVQDSLSTSRQEARSLGFLKHKEEKAKAKDVVGVLDNLCALMSTKIKDSTSTKLSISTSASSPSSDGITPAILTAAIDDFKNDLANADSVEEQDALKQKIKDLVNKRFELLIPKPTPVGLKPPPLVPLSSSPVRIDLSAPDQGAAPGTPAQVQAKVPRKKNSVKRVKKCDTDVQHPLEGNC